MLTESQAQALRIINARGPIGGRKLGEAMGWYPKNRISGVSGWPGVGGAAGRLAKTLEEMGMVHWVPDTNREYTCSRYVITSAGRQALAQQKKVEENGKVRSSC